MKISAKLMKWFSVFFCMLLLSAPLTVLAQTKVVVIPLFGDDPKPLKNIITVAKANGKFTDPVAAVNSITDASADNPYLVVIGPGVYTINQTLFMKEYVDIAGSGENVTKIKGAISTGNPDASSAIISGASNSALSSLTVENNGGEYYSIALYIDSASTTVRNVMATANSGVTETVGIRVLSCAPSIINVTASAYGGTSYGVYNSTNSSPIIRQSVMEGQTNGLYTEADSVAKVGLSTIKNGVGGWNNKCLACDDENGSPLNQFCIGIPE